jgi:hypothetical protein
MEDVFGVTSRPVVSCVECTECNLGRRKAANRLDSLLGGYDLATLEEEKGVSEHR